MVNILGGNELPLAAKIATIGVPIVLAGVVLYGIGKELLKPIFGARKKIGDLLGVA